MVFIFLQDSVLIPSDHDPIIEKRMLCPGYSCSGLHTLEHLQPASTFIGATFSSGLLYHMKEGYNGHPFLANPSRDIHLVFKYVVWTFGHCL